MTETRTPPDAANSSPLSPVENPPVPAAADTAVKQKEHIRRTPAAPGILKLAVEPFQARILIDNIEYGSAEELANGKTMPPGAHMITVQADGYELYKTAVDVTAGNTLPLSVALKPLGKGASVLDVSTYPSSTIYVDGISYGLSPRILTLAEGEHFLILQHDGYETYSEPVRVSPEKPMTVQIRLERE